METVCRGFCLVTSQPSLMVVGKAAKPCPNVVALRETRSSIDVRQTVLIRIRLKCMRCVCIDSKTFFHRNEKFFLFLLAPWFSPDLHRRRRSTRSDG